MSTDPFEIAKAKGPDLGKIRTLQRISTLKVKKVPGTQKQSPQVTDAQRPGALVKKNDPFEVSKLKRKDAEQGLAAGVGAVGGGAIGSELGMNYGARRVKSANALKLVRSIKSRGAAGAVAGASLGAVGGLQSAKFGQKRRDKKQG